MAHGVVFFCWSGAGGSHAETRVQLRSRAFFFFFFCVSICRTAVRTPSGPVCPSSPSCSAYWWDNRLFFFSPSLLHLYCPIIQLSVKHFHLSPVCNSDVSSCVSALSAPQHIWILMSFLENSLLLNLFCWFSWWLWKLSLFHRAIWRISSSPEATTSNPASTTEPRWVMHFGWNIFTKRWSVFLHERLCFFSLHCVEALQTKKAFDFSLSIVSFVETQGLKEVVSSVSVCLHVVSASLYLLVCYIMTFFLFPKHQRNDIYEEPHYKLSLPSFETNQQKKKNPPSLIKRESAAIKVWLIMYKCLFANLRPLLTKQGLNHHNSVWVRFGEVWESWKVKWQTVKWWKKSCWVFNQDICVEDQQRIVIFFLVPAGGLHP